MARRKMRVTAVTAFSKITSVITKKKFDLLQSGINVKSPSGRRGIGIRCVIGESEPFLNSENEILRDWLSYGISPLDSERKIL